MAASAGGVTALCRLLESMPTGLPVTILIVQHVDPRHQSLMAEILSRRTTMGVSHAEQGERLERGHVYVAPPDHHLLVSIGATVSLTQSELVHFVRPSADLLFESVAALYKERAIAVVLTGTGSDGAMGVRAIKKTGGTTIAQDQASSDFFGMPGEAIRTGLVDFVLPLDEIGPTLVDLIRREEAAG